MIGYRRTGMAAMLASGGGRRRAGAAACALAAAALAVPGCAALDVTPPWAPATARVVDMDSLTVRRVVGGVADVPVAPLTPEPGDIWPLQEAPRVTLADPEEALRNIPPYRPEGMRDRPLPPPGEEQRLRPARRPARGGSSAPPPPPEPRADLRIPAQPPALPATPPPARAEGRVIPYPGGQGITTGGTERYQTYNEPGTAGGGIAFPEGPMTTLIGPDGRLRVVPAPR
jgi:hypothetical protein